MLIAFALFILMPMVASSPLSISQTTIPKMGTFLVAVPFLRLLFPYFIVNYVITSVRAHKVKRDHGCELAPLISPAGTNSPSRIVRARHGETVVQKRSRSVRCRSEARTLRIYGTGKCQSGPGDKFEESQSRRKITCI